MPDPRSDVVTTEASLSNMSPARSNWRSFLDELDARWTQLGFRSFWHLEQQDFRHLASELQFSIPESSLFSQHQRHERRLTQVAMLEAGLIRSLQEALPKTWWSRLFKTLPSHLAALQRRYEELGLAPQFEQQVELFERRKLRVMNDNSLVLFDQSQRRDALREHIHSARRLFRRRQKRKLNIFDRYYRTLRELRSDPIDSELARLAADYEFLGRSRDWFREFEKLVNQAVKPTAGAQDGANEAMLRILQSDFLSLMRNRLPVYFRYFELRNRSVGDKSESHVRNFSYFEQHIIGLHRDGMDTTKCFNDFEAFVKVLEQESHEGEPVSHQDVDHSNRLEEWTRFKRQYMSPLTDVVTAFNRLRGILVQSPDWIHELRVFRSTMLVHRLMKKARKNSQQELFDAEAFVRRMTRRIDEEIATDVAYRTLERELVAKDEFLNELRIVREKIALERRASGISSARRINELKQDFVRQVWQLRSESEEGATVTPLFAKNRVEYRVDRPGTFKRQ